MALILKPDQDMVKMYLYTKIKLLSHSTFKSYNLNQKDTQTDPTEIITYPQKRMVSKLLSMYWTGNVGTMLCFRHTAFCTVWIGTYLAPWTQRSAGPSRYQAGTVWTGTSVDRCRTCRSRSLHTSCRCRGSRAPRRIRSAGWTRTYPPCICGRHINSFW